MAQIFFANDLFLFQFGDIWRFVILVLLILFVTLVAVDRTKDKEK